MLSKTADTNPRPRAVFQDAPGNFSTGIIEAVNTRDSRKMELRNAGGITFQSGARKTICITRELDIRSDIRNKSERENQRNDCDTHPIDWLTSTGMRQDWRVSV